MSDFPISLLSKSQISKRTFDEATGALRTIPAIETAFNIELDANDGDSVLTVSSSISQSCSVDSQSPQVIISEFPISGMNRFCLFAKTNEAIAAPKACKLEISPLDSGDFWIESTCEISPSPVPGSKMSSVCELIGKRARVKTSSISDGSFELIVIGNQ